MEEKYIGKILDGRYEILSVVGVGGMAVVFRAKDRRLNRMVAIKILKEDMAKDEEIRRRFHDESQAVAMMSHPNIVGVYDVNESDGPEYIVMELIEGITLKQYMKKRGRPLNWREALHFAGQIFQALKHAHSRGIIHRDIKPQNIMVLRDGSVKVADFGIARISDSQKTLTTETLGSVHYISPEQAKAEEVDCRTDLYSAGVVLYEMLTGRLPFEGDSAIAVALQHINSVPIEPRALVPEIPAGMEQITMHCMSPSLEKRYRNADEVLQDLESFRRNPAIVFPYATPWAAGEPEPAEELPPEHPEGIGAEDAVYVPADQPIPRQDAAHPSSSRQTVPGSERARDPEERREKGKHRAVIIGTVLLLIAVFVLVIAMLWTGPIASILETGETYEVPNLKGMTETAAKEYILENEAYSGHFTVTVSEETVYDANYEVGEIVSQSPNGGSTTKSESTEIIVILCAEEPVEEVKTMPNLAGMDYHEATTLLEDDYNVTVKYAGRNSSDYAVDQVISTDPAVGAELTDGQSVTLYYSKGPEVKKVTMISVEGLTLELATEKLEAIGLKVGETITVESDVEAGLVVYQSVRVSDEVNEGTEVNLHISSGPAQEEPEEPENPDDTQDVTETHRVVITMPEGRTADSYLKVSVGDTVVHEGTMTPEQTTLSLTIEGSADGLSVTVDGEAYDNYTVD